MNILVVNWQDIRNPNAGGAEVHLHEVFSRIAGMGHRVTLYCSSFPGAPREETIDGMHILREGGRYVFNLRPFLAYLRHFRHSPYDVVVDDLNKIPFFLPAYVNEPVCCVTHHLFDTSIFRETNAALASYVYLMERSAIAFYCRRRVPFVVGSPSTKEELVQRGCRAEDVTVVNYAVDHATHRRTGVPKSAVPLIGYFGRLKRYKSVHHLLEALPGVVAEVPDLRVMIVGEGDDRPRLEAIAREKGLSRLVEFTGYVSEERKMELLQQMWCKVMTSSKEGWGLTVLEANACGTAVIASRVPGLRDAVRDGETGLLYSYGETAELAEKTIRLLKDRAYRERLSTEALHWSKTFTWERAAEETLDVLKKVGSRTSSP
ncbi:MAG: glycosyltransferase family 4 protein [Bacteroidota bacterium]